MIFPHFSPSKSEALSWNRPFQNQNPCGIFTWCLTNLCVGLYDSQKNFIKILSIFIIDVLFFHRFHSQLRRRAKTSETGACCTRLTGGFLSCGTWTKSSRTAFFSSHNKIQNENRVQNYFIYVCAVFRCSKIILLMSLVSSSGGEPEGGEADGGDA